MTRRPQDVVQILRLILDIVQSFANLSFECVEFVGDGKQQFLVCHGAVVKWVSLCLRFSAGWLLIYVDTDVPKKGDPWDFGTVTG